MTRDPRSVPPERVLLAVIAVLAVAVVAVAAATAQPAPPEAYYGSVTVNDQPAPDGVTVSAVVDGDVVDSITVSDGSYGGAGAFDEKLVVNASEGTTVRFLVGGLDTGQTDAVTPGESTELNLTATDDQSPDADAGPDATVGVGESLAFDGSGSTDDGQLVSYEWDLDGDGSVDATGVTVNHSYGQSGTYDAVLTVVDAGGNDAQDTRTVTVEESDTAANETDENTNGGGGTGGATGTDDGGETTETTTDTGTTSDAESTDGTTSDSGTTDGTTATDGTPADGENQSDADTETNGGTPTTEASEANADETTDDGGASSPTETGGQPGFGVATALLAIVLVGFLVARR